MLPQTEKRQDTQKLPRNEPQDRYGQQKKKKDQDRVVSTSKNRGSIQENDEEKRETLPLKSTKKTKKAKGYEEKGWGGKKEENGGLLSRMKVKSRTNNKGETMPRTRNPSEKNIEAEEPRTEKNFDQIGKVKYEH